MLTLDKIHQSWKPVCEHALSQMDPDYLAHLMRLDAEGSPWLPGFSKLFNAFTLPKPDCRYIVFGEAPYPRASSANGFAFWDAAVESLWGPQGFSTAVNRATSLRNFLKMLLVASGNLKPDQTDAVSIQQLEKIRYIPDLPCLFKRLLGHGFLLLNASLVLGPPNLMYHAKHWRVFIQHCLAELGKAQLGGKQPITLILMGRIAKQIQTLPAAKTFPKVVSQHPYQLSFINNPEILNFFRPFHLLEKNQLDRFIQVHQTDCSSTA